MNERLNPEKKPLEDAEARPKDERKNDQIKNNTHISVGS